jgi:hypothetical protein
VSRPKPEWVTELDANVTEFAELIARLPRELLRPTSWGPREILAHIVFAHEIYVRELRATARGGPPELFAHTGQEQNRMAVAENGSVSVDELLRRLMSAQRKLAKLVVRPDVQAVSFYYRATSQPREVPQAMRLIAGHFRGHMRDVRKAAKIKPPARRR